MVFIACLLTRAHVLALLRGCSKCVEKAGFPDAAGGAGPGLFAFGQASGAMRGFMKEYQHTYRLGGIAPFTTCDRMKKRQ
jgi:hypothetical protein